MRQLETNLNFISTLPDDPSTTTAALKQEFDKAGNVIKDFINDELEPDITTDIASSLATAKSYTDSAVGAIDLGADNINYDNTSSGLAATNVQNAIDEVKSAAATTAAAKTVYGDFQVTSHSSGTLDNGHGGAVTKTISISKSGYYPLGIVGYTSWSRNNYNNTSLGPCLMDLYLSSRSSGSGVITGKTFASNNEAWTYNSGFTAYVLWVKVR